MDPSILLPIIATLMFSAFFSGIEIAFVSADRLHIELQNKKGLIAGRIVSKFIQNASRFISTTLVGNTLALVLYGIYMAKLLDPIIRSSLPEIFLNEPIILFSQTVLSTIIVLFTAEFLPKSIFLLNPNWMLSIFAIPMDIIYRLMYPIVVLVVSLSKFIITKVLRQKYEEDKPAFRLTDLNNYIRNTLMADEETNVEVDTKIFNNALEFKSIRVRECMLPRTEIVAVDIEDTIEELKKAFIDSGHSKILVYRESIDDVIGYCHSLELFKKPKSIENMLTPIIIVPETMLANELMIQFISERKSLALVVDEFGGTSGIVSIEDIIEEIFGEIQDEHDDEDWVEQELDPNTYLFSARHEIDYLNDKYNWDLPIGDYETLGGLILSLTEDLPKAGDVVKSEDYTFIIQTTNDIRIDTVKLLVDKSR
ncbi:hemolysin family protein [Fulvivirga lutea]|uniref:HlyC/CorC family transporter n=1 Tax=Fulvivirga lutea TaxID=2810512 RepID=A0A975A1S4_9BACT|nr:hemolysin family protein [Fulvivirga lutea]QSE98739.1 HlyC/CorC family transporter [Fulvivirga lutea]